MSWERDQQEAARGAGAQPCGVGMGGCPGSLPPSEDSEDGPWSDLLPDGVGRAVRGAGPLARPTWGRGLRCGGKWGKGLSSCGTRTGGCVGTSGVWTAGWMRARGQRSRGRRWGFRAEGSTSLQGLWTVPSSLWLGLRWLSFPWRSPGEGGGIPCGRHPCSGAW